MRLAQRGNGTVRRSRGLLLGLAMVVTLVGATGLECDSDASATFRQEATGPIGEGVKTIIEAVIDGLVAAIEQAGDGS